MPQIYPALTPPPQARQLGRWGEQVVRDWCLEQGWVLLGVHVTARDSELDLVVRDGDRIAFGEVKVRRSIWSGSALESLSRSKIGKIRAGAERWIGLTAPHPAEWHFHFDLFLLEPHPRGGWELTYLPDAFTGDVP